MRKADLGRKYRINCDITRNDMKRGKRSVSPSLKLVQIELKVCCNYSEYLLREQRYRRVGDLNRRRGSCRIRSRSDMFFQEDMKLYVGGEKKGKGQGWE